MKRREVCSGAVHQVYQTTLDGGSIFTSVKDYLVFFTLLCSYARRLGVKVLSLCPRDNQVCQTAVAQSQRQLSGYVQNYTRLFAREWNKTHGRKGSVFRHPFECSVKTGIRKVRAAIADCNGRALEYRWNFLSYYRNPSPCSPRFHRSRASSWMRMAMTDVCRLFERGGYVNYERLDTWEKVLSVKEWKQLTDCIIGLWNVIDYEGAAGYFGDYETMLLSMQKKPAGAHTRGLVRR